MGGTFQPGRVGIEVLEGAQSGAEVGTGVQSFGRACAVQESPMAMCFLQGVNTPKEVNSVTKSRSSCWD